MESEEYRKLEKRQGMTIEEFGKAWRNTLAYKPQATLEDYARAYKQYKEVSGDTNLTFKDYAAKLSTKHKNELRILIEERKTSIIK